jgi:hypothetical protein
MKIAVYPMIVFLLALAEPAFAFDPSNPGASNYVLVFDDEFNSMSTIDTGDTRVPGFNWYLYQPFGARTKHSNPADLSISDGVVTITPTGPSKNGSSIMTIAIPQSEVPPKGYVGRAFGGGKGFYIEARIAFDNSLVKTAKGWPNFWGESVEHIIGHGADQWPGQPSGYAHFIEDDFFEYDIASFAGPNAFGSSRHDWYGLYNVTCKHKRFCGILSSNYAVKMPNKITWTAWHTYGQLYIPASGNSAGSFQMYFDRKPTGNVQTWINAPDGAPPPSGKSSFSIMDKQSLAIILGSGIGQPMKVDYVHVWEHP